MAIEDLDKLERRVRRMIGSPDCDEFTYEWYSDIFDEAVKELSRYFPVSAVVTISLISGQSRYDFPSGYFAIDPNYKFGSGVASYNLTGYAPDVYAPSNYGEGSLWLQTMDMKTDLHIMETAEQTFPGRQYYNEDGKILVIPTPSVNEQVYLPMWGYREVTDVPPEHEEMLRNLIASKAALELAAYRGKFEKIKVGVHETKLRDPQWLIDLGNSFKDKFDDLAASMSASALIE